METEAIDWSECPIVETVPGRMNGKPVVKGTRMPADGVVENFETGSPISEIAWNFGLKEDDIRTILSHTNQRNSYVENSARPKCPRNLVITADRSIQ